MTKEEIMLELKEKTIAEIVTENVKTSDVFKRHGIDFCCGGHTNVVIVCEKHGLDFNQIEIELKESVSNTLAVHDFDTWELDFLIDYIVNTHHKYVSNNVDLMLEYTQKVANVHGEHRPEVVEINRLTQALVNELGPHMKKEEQILFPYVKELIRLKNKGEKVTKCGIKSPISVMEQEHENAGDIIKEIARLSDNFTVPECGCNTYRAMYSKLEEFQNDLFQHIHLENNILFPKAIRLEEEISL